MKKRKIAAGILAAVVMLTAGFAFQTDLRYGNSMTAVPKAVAAEIEEQKETVATEHAAASSKEANTEFSADSTTETDTESSTVSSTEADTESSADSNTEVDTESSADSTTEVDAESSAAPTTEVDTESSADSTTEVDTESSADSTTEVDMESSAAPTTEAETKSAADLAEESGPESHTETEAASSEDLSEKLETEQSQQPVTESITEIQEKSEMKQLQTSLERASQVMGKTITVFQDGMTWPTGYEHYFNSYSQSSQRIGFSSDFYPNGFSTFYSAPLENTEAMGEIGVRYSKVGKYQGQDIDLEIIAMDWGATSDMKVGGTFVTVAGFEKGDVVKPTVAFSKKRPRIFVTGTEYIDFSFRFYISGTNTPVSVKGHSTAVDLDAKQGVKFLSGVDSAYIAKNSSLTVDSYNKVYSENSGNTDSDDQTAWVSFNFSSESHRVRFYCGLYWDRLEHDSATEDYGYATSFDIIEFSPRLLTDVSKSFHVRVAKKDSETGNSLTGAIFQLDQWSMEQNQYVTVGNLTDQKDGTYELQNVFYSDDNQGMFRIREEQPPTGYQQSDWQQEFTTDGFADGHTFLYTVENTHIKTAVKVHKKDQDSGENLKGAVYGIYLDEACTKKAAETSASDASGNGTTPWFRKTQETYYVKELKAPAGYFLDETVTAVKAGEDTIVTVERTNVKALGKVAIAKAADRTKTAGLNQETGRYAGNKEAGYYGPGEWITFDICVTNTGNTTVKNLKVTEEPGACLQEIWEEETAAYVFPENWTTRKGAKITGSIDSSDPWILRLNTLEPGDSVSFQFRCQLKEHLKEPEEKLENQVSVTGEYLLPDGSGTGAITPDEDDSDSDEVLAAVPAISVTKLADRTTGVELINGRYQGERVMGWYMLGETVDYTIRISNDGNVPALDLLLEEQVSEELCAVMEPDSAAYQGLEGLVSEQGRAVSAAVDETDSHKLHLDRLEAGDCVEVHLTLKIRDRGIEKLEKLPNTVCISGKYQIPEQEKLPDIPKDEDDEDLEWIRIYGAKLYICKRDREDGMLLADAEFELQTLDGEVLETMITNEEGMGESTYLPLDIYLLVETKAPEGYEMEPEPREVVFTEEQQELVITVENDKILPPEETEYLQETETEPESQPEAVTESETAPAEPEAATIPEETESETTPAKTESETTPAEPETAITPEALDSAVSSTAAPVKTGDSSGMGIWLTVLLVSGGILAFGMLRKYRGSGKKENE